MRYLLCLLILCFVTTRTVAQGPVPENSVQSDPKKQKKYNKEKAKKIKQEKRDIERAKRDLIRMQDPATRKRMKKNLRRANKFNGQKRKNEDPLQ